LALSLFSLLLESWKLSYESDIKNG